MNVYSRRFVDMRWESLEFRADDLKRRVLGNLMFALNLRLRLNVAVTLVQSCDC